MEFQISGKRKSTIYQEIEGTIEISKKEVMKVTGCPSVKDGDSTAWYSYVGEAIELGALFYYNGVPLNVTSTYKQLTSFDDIEVDW